MAASRPWSVRITHIPTADETILPGGTAYQTDAGMTGPFFSVIGVVKEDVIRRFLTQIPERFEPASQDARLKWRVDRTLDSATGKAATSREFTNVVL